MVKNSHRRPATPQTVHGRGVGSPAAHDRTVSHNVHEEQMMRRFALITALLGTLFGGWHVGPGAAAAEHRTVRDAL